MVLEFLFAAGVGAAITGAASQKLDEAKSKRAESMIDKANDYHLQGRCKEAISLLEEAAKLTPFEPRIYMLMCKAYSGLAMEEDSKSSKLAAIDMALQCYDAIQWLLGQGVFIPQDILKEYEKASESLRVIRDVTTGRIQVQSEKGEEYEREADSASEAGDFRKALEYLTKAIRVETADVIIAQYHAKRALTRFQLGDNAGAMSDCRTALKCEELTVEAREYVKNIQRHARAEQYAHEFYLAMEAQNGKKALQYITKAINTGTNETTIASYHVQRAILRQAVGDYSGALSDCEIALKCQGLDDKIRKTAREYRRSVKSKQQAKKTPSKSAAQSTRTSPKARAGVTRKRAA